MIDRLDYYSINTKASNSLLAAKKHVTSIDDKLTALVELRVSQINGCAYCVDLHSEEARAAGETQQRLDCLAAWRECSFFDARERVAFAWAESLTHISNTHAPDDIYNALADHFSEQEIVDLSFIISMMNLWNRIAIGFRHGPDERT